MDFQEILDIFEEADISQIDGECSEILGSSYCSESVENSLDEEMEDIDNPCFGCNFDAETALDSKIDIENLNIKEIISDEIMRYHFPDREVAFMFYNWYGRLHGFSGRKCRVIKNTKGEVIQQTFVCHREGTRDANNRVHVSRKRAPRPNTRCGCPAKLQVHLDFGSGRWYIKLFDDIHNHSFLDDKYEGMLPAHRKMSDYDKYQMKTMRKAGIPMSRIYGFFASQVGGYENLGYSRRDMYNEQFKHGGRNSSDAEEAINFLKGMCDSDDMMYWRHTVNEDGSLRHLFWCDGVSRMDFSVFGDVLAFDATYRKIKYNTPLVIFSGVNHHNKSVIFASAIVSDETEETYVWLLQSFVEAMEGKLPVSVITDGDLAMRNAIRRVFPHAHHHLCAWHLIRNASSNIKDPKFLPKFKQCLFGDFDIDEFDCKWEALVVEFGLEDNNWIQEMYEKRTMWSTAHIRGNFFAGFRTTSRCEGLHSEFGKYVSVLSNLLDFLHHIFRWMSYVRYREIENDYESSFGDTVLQTQLTCLERSASNLYTRSVFKIFRPMLERSCKCKVEGVVQSGSVFTYVVYKYPRQDIQWAVTYCQDKLIFECSCKRFETFGIPCEHVISVLVYMNIVVLPECIVLKRWTKDAKVEINAMNANSLSHRDPAFICSYVTFVERCKRMVNAAFMCGKPEVIHNTIEMVENRIDVLEAVRRGEVDDLSMLGVNGRGCVGNPERRKRKGETIASSSRIPNERTKQNSPKCGICRRKGHNRKSCRFRGEPNLPSNTHVIDAFNYKDEFVEDNDDWNLSMELN